MGHVSRWALATVACILLDLSLAVLDRAFHIQFLVSPLVQFPRLSLRLAGTLMSTYDDFYKELSSAGTEGPTRTLYLGL